MEDITEELEKQSIRLLHENELNEEQQLFIRRLYLEKLNGSTNPIWLSQVKEIGATGDEGIFIAVTTLLSIGYNVVIITLQAILS